MFDAEPKRVVGLIELDKTFGTDVLTSAILDFGEGRHLTFTVGTQTAPHQRVNVVGSTGRIEVLIPFNAPPMQETVIRLDRGKALGDAEIEEIRLPACDQYGLQGEAFAKAIRGVEPLPYDQRDAVRMMKILDAIVESGKTGRWVSL